MDKYKMSASDARETYEMLRAAHTLLRMAFGAIAMTKQPGNKSAARAITEPFDKCFKLIADGATFYLDHASKDNESGDSKPNN